MFEKQFLLVTLLLVFSSTVTANEKVISITQINTDIGYDNGVFTPSGTLPVNWNSRFSSSISYVGKQTIDIGSLSDFDDSLNASTTKERRMGLNLLTYEFNPTGSSKSTISIGLSYENVKIEAEEKGFIAHEGDAFRTELLRDISVHRANIPVSYQIRSGNFINRFNANLTAYSSLSLEQDLYIPIINTKRTALSDSQTQPVAYQASWEGIYTRTANIAAPGWSIAYESTPFEYNSLMANANGSFDTNKIKSTTNTLTIEGRIYYGWNPNETTARYIGVRRELITATMESPGEKNEEDLYITSLVIGVDGRF